MNWDEIDNPYKCTVCGREDCIPPRGPTNSPILVVGSAPGDDEIREGKPFVGRTGGVMKAEFGYVGIDLDRLRLMNMWHHEPPKQDDQNYEACFKEGIRQVLEEAKDRKVILLIGSDTVKYFCNENVSEVHGLLVKSNYLSAPVIFASMQPTIVFHGGLGETRLAIQKFAKFALPLLTI